MTITAALPDGWTPDGSGYKGPCPLCRGGGRRAWARPYSGRWRARCDSCGARSAALLSALGMSGARAPAAVPASTPVDTSAADWAAALPAVYRGAGRRYLDRRGLSPVADLRWADLAALDRAPFRWWLFPVRVADRVIGGGLTASRNGYNRALLAGCLVWIWRLPARGGSLEVCGIELDGVTADGGRLHFSPRNGPEPVKRPAVVGTHPKAGAFIAARPTGPGRGRLHVTEGGPDGLALAAFVPTGEGVVSAHGARALLGMLPWCRCRSVTVWAHRDDPGKAGALELGRAVFRTGRPVYVNLPPAGGDWADGGESAILTALEREGMRSEC